MCQLGFGAIRSVTVLTIFKKPSAFLLFRSKNPQWALWGSDLFPLRGRGQANETRVANRGTPAMRKGQIALDLHPNTGVQRAGLVFKVSKAKSSFRASVGPIEFSTERQEICWVYPIPFLQSETNLWDWKMCGPMDGCGPKVGEPNPVDPVAQWMLCLWPTGLPGDTHPAREYHGCSTT